MGKFALSFVALSLVLGSVSFADEQLPLPLPNPNEARDVERILARIDSGAIEINIGNGDYGVDTFVPAKLTEAKAKREIAKRSGPSGICRFETAIGDSAWLDLIKGSPVLMESDIEKMDAEDALYALKQSNQVLMIIQRVWDGMADKSETCSLRYYDIYFKGGKKLRIDIDETT
ncbi:MAG: hypothetical protein V4692_12360 [Bdellovibrionota bacterium]